MCVRDLFGPEEEGGERQQWKLDQCVYVGDSPSDGAAAKAAGMRSVGVSYGSHPLETVEPAFDQTVHSVEELEEALMKLVTGGASSASSSSSPALMDCPAVPLRCSSCKGASSSSASKLSWHRKQRRRAERERERGGGHTNNAVLRLDVV